MLWFLVFLSIALTAAWHRAGLRATRIAFAVALGFYAFFGSSLALLVLLGLLWLALFLPLQLAPLRQEWISRPLLRWLDERRPPAPSAAHAAPDDTCLDWAWWLAAPAESLTPSERRFLDETVEAACRDAHDVQAWQALIAAAVPARFGGGGFSVFARQALLDRVAASDPLRAQVLAGAYAATRLIAEQAGETQQQDWLGQVARGLRLHVLQHPREPAWAGLNPDTARPATGVWQGRETAGLRLRFDKRAAAGAHDAAVLLVALDLHEPDGARTRITPGWAWLPADTPGLSEDRLHAQDVFVPRACWFAGDNRRALDRAIPAAARRALLAERGAVRRCIEPDAADDPLARLGVEAYAQEALRAHAATPLAAATPLWTVAGSQTNAARRLQVFDEALLESGGRALSAATHSLLLALSFGRLQSPPVLGPLSAAFGRFSRYDAARVLLATVWPWLEAGAQTRLGAALGTASREQRRAACVLRRFEREGRPPHDEALARAALDETAQRLEHALDAAIHALPSPWLRAAVRVLVFPLGRWARPMTPADAAAIVARLQDPHRPPLSEAAARAPERLRLRAALLLAAQSQALWRRLDEPRLREPRRLDRIHEALGLGLLSAAEAAQLRELHNLGESGDDEHA